MNALGREIAYQLPFENKRKILVNDHDTNDIIRWIAKLHPVNAANYDQIAELHWQGDAGSTAKHLFDFCKKNIRYDIESAEDQTIKKPGAILAHGYGDCKHYASYIVGVCDSLRRMGYPIKAKYRFTADRPGMEVHHVFAVVSEPGQVGYPSRAKQWGADKIRDYAAQHGLRLVHGYETEGRTYAVSGTSENEWWVDPVLNSFNKRPNYHNIKDKDMSLTLISGTDGDDNDNGIGKNIFKEIAHGLDVNFKNIKKGVDVNTANIKKGVNVNTANIKKGVTMAVKETAKGLKITANNVKKVMLKVYGAGARNSFLALVDFNVLNLAKKLHASLNSPQRKDLLRKWSDIGGDPNKLISAVANGIKNYNKHHAKKISGMTLDQAVAHYQNHEYPWNASHLPHYSHAGKHVYMLRGTEIGCSGCNAGAVGCGGNQIGCLPACAPALIALAAAIVAALAPFLKMSPKEQADMAAIAKAGADNVIKDTANGIDIAEGNQGQAAANALDQLTKSYGGDTQNMQVSTGVDEDGNPLINVQGINHPLVNKAGEPMTDEEINNPAKRGASMLPNISDITGKIKEVWRDYKTPIVLFTAGAIALKSKRVRKTLGIK